MERFYSICCQGVILEFVEDVPKYRGKVLAATCAMKALMAELESGRLACIASRSVGGWTKRMEIPAGEKGIFYVDRPLLTQNSEYCARISKRIGLASS